MRKFKLRWRDGAEYDVPLVEEDRRRLLAEVNGIGGANDILRWIRANTVDLNVPNKAVARITDGIIERVVAITEWDEGRGGFQNKVPVESMRRAGLLAGATQPTQAGLI